MKFIKYIFLITAIFLASCESLVEDINLNPNAIAVDEVEATSFLTGILLANSSLHVSHSNRITGLWTGQLVGYTSLYSNIYGYNISTAESVDPWSRVYIAIIPNVRHIQSTASGDALLTGITKVVEGMAISTAASIFGDIPYSQVNSEVEDPVFESQVAVLTAALSLLDNAIADLNGASSRGIAEDIYFGGDADKWKAAAHTVKARIHMWMRDYSAAYAAAQNGIASAGGNLQHIPRGDAAVNSGDKNLFYVPLAGSRAGDIGSRDSYMLSMLDAASEATYRGNAKTDEAARLAYYTINESTASANMGFANQFEPQDIVSFQENHLILAEAGARTSGFDKGLQHLNEYRAYLDAGGDVNDNFQDLPHVYLPYEMADFEAGGMENNGESVDKALLKEIIEERYISGFGMFMPFDDARRLRKSDPDLVVPFPLNTASASAYPERLPYSDDELNTNENAPADDPGIFVKTEVNR